LPFQSKPRQTFRAVHLGYFTVDVSLANFVHQHLPKHTLTACELEEILLSARGVVFLAGVVIGKQEGGLAIFADGGVDVSGAIGDCLCSASALYGDLVALRAGSAVQTVAGAAMRRATPCCSHHKQAD
jgi:hypothetical protein